MTRGKYGRAAAQRRAASAEEQLDRLYPQLVEAKRVAAQYRSDAEATVALRRELAELRDVVGVPVKEHEQALEDLRRRHAQTQREMEKAFDVLMEELAVAIDPDVEMRISPRMVRALKEVPRPMAIAYLTAAGFEREFQRTLLAMDPNTIGNLHEPELMAIRAQAHQAGYGHDSIPEDWVYDRQRTKAGRRRTSVLEDAEAVYMKALNQFISDIGPDHPLGRLRVLWNARWPYIRALATVGSDE